MSITSSWQCMMKQTLKFKNKFKHILKIEFLKSPWSLRKQTNNKRPLLGKKICSAISLPHFLLWKKGEGIKTNDWILGRRWRFWESAGLYNHTNSAYDFCVICTTIHLFTCVKWSKNIWGRSFGCVCLVGERTIEDIFWVFQKWGQICKTKLISLNTHHRFDNAGLRKRWHGFSLSSVPVSLPLTSGIL